MNAPRTRVQRRPVHGVLLLDKPLGLSSNQALQKAKWLLRAEKAGHTGTLDPLATGVLPLCFGAATKFSQQHLDADKTYETTVRLGVKTSTADAEGEAIETREVRCTPGQVVEVLDRFMGPISQVPPMHSALKKDGKALYEYAREGETVEREARHVVIHDLELLDMQLQGDAPFLRLRVHCSKGTYIRTLGEDIAEALGCGGHLSALRRVVTGPFEEAQCVTLEALEPFRKPWTRPQGDPRPLPYLDSPFNRDAGALDVTLEVWEATPEQVAGATALPPVVLRRSSRAIVRQAASKSSRSHIRRAGRSGTAAASAGWSPPPATLRAPMACARRCRCGWP